jgi:LPXTG-motif cell wall-anchored protein
MKKHTTTVGPTSLGWVRSLLTFRHGNPVARLLSTIAAFAIALLLVAGTAPAYAEDGDAAPAETSVAEPAADDTAEAPADDTEAPAPESTGGDQATETDTSGDAKNAEEPAASGDAADSSAPAKKATISSALATLADVDPAAAPSDPDWIWQGSAPTLEDGEKDDTAYGGGSSEDTNPSTWSQAGADTPKADLLKYYFNVDTSGDIIVSFGFTRASINGDTAFAAEFNQLENSSNTPPRPVRSVGDLLLKFHVDSGNATLEFVHAYVWTDEDDFAAHVLAYPGFTCEERYGSGFGWCEIPRTSGTFDTRIADDGYTAEAQVNLTDLFPTEGCSPIFHSVNLRGESSAENWTNSLQDYLPLPGAEVASTCASLVIKKFREGTTTLLTGAHFDVYEGPDTTGTKIYSDVADGDAEDADSEVGQITLMDLDPGTYTVVEIAPPGSDTPDPNDDYFIADPPGDTITLTVGESATATFNFYDVKKWQPLDITKSAAGTFGARYLWDIEKQIAPTATGPWSDGTTPSAPLVKTTSGLDQSLYYRVVVTENGIDATNYVVTGTIDVDNPNDEAVDATISESLDGCVIDSEDDSISRTVPAGGATYGYTCDLGDNLEVVPDSNTATVTWDISTYPQDEADIGDAGDYTDSDTASNIVWTETSTDQTITVTDDHFDFEPDWVITWGDDSSAEDGDGVGVYASDVYSVNAGPVAAGACSAVITNTATITGDAEAVLGSTSESGQVCVPAIIPPLPPEVIPPTLPNTGGPNAMILAAGVALLLGGSGLVIGDRRRRRRS